MKNWWCQTLRLLSDEHEFEVTLSKITNGLHWAISLIDLGMLTIFLKHVVATIVVIPLLAIVQLDLVLVQVEEHLLRLLITETSTEAADNTQWSIDCTNIGLLAISLNAPGVATVVFKVDAVVQLDSVSIQVLKQPHLVIETIAETVVEHHWSIDGTNFGLLTISLDAPGMTFVVLHADAVMHRESVAIQVLEFVNPRTEVGGKSHWTIDLVDHVDFPILLIHCHAAMIKFHLSSSVELQLVRIEIDQWNLVDALKKDEVVGTQHLYFKNNY